MKTPQTVHKTITDFTDSVKGKVLIAGYGSLLSQYSRQTYSQIMGPSLPVIIEGWERNWITRSLSEKQTYAGAIPHKKSQLSAQLLALQFDESFEKREQDYRFTQISPSCIVTQGAMFQNNPALQQLFEKTPVYICETLSIEPSSQRFPVSLSYVETCLAGSYESNGIKGIEAFLDHTNGWNSTYFNDDRHSHRYPRSSPVSQHELESWGARYGNLCETLINT